MLHVTPAQEHIPTPQPSSPIWFHDRESGKSKTQLTAISDEEDLLLRFTSALDIAKTAGDPTVSSEPAVLRKPRRQIMSGRDLHSTILGMLPSTRLKDGQDETSHVKKLLKHHPAIHHLEQQIPTYLSAWDRARCENQSWAQKYGPKRAEHVLQPGREVLLLRDWLKLLTVSSVETGANSVQVKNKNQLLNKRKKKKKRKRAEKLDNFIVSSDEEANQMDELSTSEDELSAVERGSQGSQKTVVRTGDKDKQSKDSGRVTNAVLISGPSGCGKTASVYAVAKELDFEVFEINPGSRRSGKDILDKIGDMLQNHLVNHAKGEEQSQNAEDTLAAARLAKEISSGKQGTMNSFFTGGQTKSAAKPEAEEKSVDAETLKAAAPKTKTSQKQSLILLEEVDILFAEDKPFWAVVISLIAQSKRPIIMTCNDESLVPKDDLTLYGIFRYTRPAIELTVDYLLCMAAIEGHILDRDSLSSLYRSKQCDFRATITELDFWCQMAIGDRKAGLEWMLDRWPTGVDRNNDGEPLRAISGGTYCKGMGWTNRDDSSSTIDPNNESRALLHGMQTWELSGTYWAQTHRPYGRYSIDPSNSDEDQLCLWEDRADFWSIMDVRTGFADTVLRGVSFELSGDKSHAKRSSLD